MKRFIIDKYRSLILDQFKGNVTRETLLEKIFLGMVSFWISTLNDIDDYQKKIFEVKNGRLVLNEENADFWASLLGIGFDEAISFENKNKEILKKINLVLADGTIPTFVNIINNVLDAKIIFFKEHSASINITVQGSTVFNNKELKTLIEIIKPGGVQLYLSVANSDYNKIAIYNTSGHGYGQGTYSSVIQ